MQEFALEIIIPPNIEIIHLKNKVRFRGTKDDIYEFAEQFMRLKELPDCTLCKLDKYTLKVSDYMTEDRFRKDWIELPNHAWVIVACKFREVASDYEESPFYFNECRYTNRIPFDIGVEVTDIPKRS